MRFSETSTGRLETGDGQMLDIHIWEPKSPRAVFMAVHGGLAHAGDYVTPALYFKEREIATVAYDLRGHKQEKVFIKGFDQLVSDTARFLDWTVERYPGLPVFFLGHSVGALIGTHFGLGPARYAEVPAGYIFSSPYYANAIKVSPLVLSMIRIADRVFPRAPIPGPDITDMLTHDVDITRRHHRDAADGLRAQKASLRFGAELLRAQAWVASNIGDWHHDLLVFVAGRDQVADSAITRQLLDKIDPSKCTQVFHEHNFHENFNEINRDETFLAIEAWIDKILAVQ